MSQVPRAAAPQAVPSGARPAGHTRFLRLVELVGSAGLTSFAPLLSTLCGPHLDARSAGHMAADGPHFLDALARDGDNEARRLDVKADCIVEHLQSEPELLLGFVACGAISRRDWCDDEGPRLCITAFVGAARSGEHPVEPTPGPPGTDVPGSGTRVASAPAEVQGDVPRSSRVALAPTELPALSRRWS